MTARHPETTLTALSHAHQQRLEQTIHELTCASHDPATVALLSQIAAQLPYLRAQLPAADRAAIDELDANEAALCAASAAASAAATPLLAALAAQPTPQLLIDPTALHALAEVALQLAQSASEVALRARARALLLTAD